MYKMKMALATIGLICLFYLNLIYCSPIYQSNVNSCNITSNDQEFDLNQVEKKYLVYIIQSNNYSSFKI